MLSQLPNLLVKTPQERSGLDVEEREIWRRPIDAEDQLARVGDRQALELLRDERHLLQDLVRLHPEQHQTRSQGNRDH